MNWQVGDVVRLKSGGPKMTVSGMGHGGGLICCEYFVGDEQNEWAGEPEMLALAWDDEGFYDVAACDVDDPDFDDDAYDAELEAALAEYWMLHGHDLDF